MTYIRNVAKYQSENLKESNLIVSLHAAQESVHGLAFVKTVINLDIHIRRIFVDVLNK
jgi:hypothetical protein